MNFKTRLSKIEDKLNINSGFCNCPGGMSFKVVPAESRLEEPETKYCDDCRKPMLNRPPITFKINGNFEYQVIEPTTNFTRQEFEDWQNEHVMSAHQTYEEYLREKNQNEH